MKLDIDAFCDKGLVRDTNEDMVSVGGILKRDDSLHLPVTLNSDGMFYLFVADGMGGHENGEYASQYLQEHLRDCFTMGDIAEDSFEDDIRNRVKYVSEDLNDIARHQGQTRPMGCTLTGVVWTSDKTFLVNAGDSRTYRFRDGMLRQLTKDETQRGLTGDPNASKGLLNCVGGGSFGRLTVEDITGRLAPGDVLLICSDGLTDLCQDEEIEEILSSTDRVAKNLVAKANENGGNDNISVIVARLLKDK